MWNTGFAKHLKEILENFLGECQCEWNRDSRHYLFKIKEDDQDSVEVIIEETFGVDGVTYSSTLTYDALYEILVPKHRMEYLYIFQSIMDELEDPNLQEVSNGVHFEKLMHRISSTFFEQRDLMKKEVTKESEEEIIPEQIYTSNRIVFIANGIEYEQMALF